MMMAKILSMEDVFVYSGWVCICRNIRIVLIVFIAFIWNLFFFLLICPDVYSYDEDDMVLDSKLPEHLSHFGIDMMTMEKVSFVLMLKFS